MANKLPLAAGGVQFGHMVERDGYFTDLVPVKSPSVTTMDGVDHYEIIGYRRTLTVRLNPQSLDQLAAFIAAFSGIREVTYFHLQLNQMVTERMAFTPGSASYLSRCLAGRKKWAEMESVTLEGIMVFA